MASENDLNLPPLNPADLSFDHNAAGDSVARSGPVPVKTAEDLEQVFDVPVTVSAVLGSSRIAVGDLLRVTPGTVLELDRRVGEAIDIFVNERLVARGEYSIKVEGTDVSGAAITVKTEITGKVDGIDFSTTVPTLLIGAIKVPLDKVKSVKSTS